MTDFYDASNWRNIPHGSTAMLYDDGEFAVPASAPAQLQLAAWRFITVTGDPAGSGAIDWEEGNPCFTPAGLYNYVAGRQDMGRRARVYAQRSLLSAALDALADGPQGSMATYPGLLWWIPTLDGQKRTAQQLADDCAAHFNADLPVATIWAQQYTQIPQLGPRAVADVSVLFGEF